MVFVKSEKAAKVEIFFFFSLKKRLKQFIL